MFQENIGFLEAQVKEATTKLKEARNQFKLMKKMLNAMQLNPIAAVS